MIGEIDMIRTDMISTVGREYLTSNIENDEYSYPKAFAAQSLTFNPIRNKAGRAFEKLDIRFVKDNITVLIGLIYIQHYISFQCLNRRNTNTVMAELSRWN